MIRIVGENSAQCCACYDLLPTGAQYFDAEEDGGCICKPCIKHAVSDFAAQSRKELLAEHADSFPEAPTDTEGPKCS